LNQATTPARDNPEFVEFARKQFGWRVRDFAGNHGPVELVYRTWLAMASQPCAHTAEQLRAADSRADESQELEAQQKWWTNYVANNELGSKNPAMAAQDAWMHRSRQTD
jgi:hypothetical protein